MRRAVALGAACMLALAGCILVTGGTDGYSGGDAGGLTLACLSPKDCADQGGVCCLSASGSSCSSSCGIDSVQMCSVAQDCGDGGICLQQSGPIDGGPTLPVSACQVIPYCSQ